MEKKVVQTPLMKMLNPLYHFKSKEEEERDFQAIRMYKVEKGSSVFKTENLVGTDIFHIEELQREEDLQYEKEQKSPAHESSKREENCKPFRRDVEVIRVLKRMHTNAASKDWKNKLSQSSKLANKSKLFKFDEVLSTDFSTEDYIDWAYQDTMRNVKTTRNFILGTAEKLKTYESKISRIYLPHMVLNKENHTSSTSTRKTSISSSIGQQSSKALLPSPAALISGASLAEKLDKLEKKLKKKENLRHRIDSSMYNIAKVKRFNHKGSRSSALGNFRNSIISRSNTTGRNSVASRNSVTGRNSVKSTASTISESSSHSLEGPVNIHSPKPPPGKNNTSGSGPANKHRKISIPNTGDATDSNDVPVKHMEAGTDDRSAPDNNQSQSINSKKDRALKPKFESMSSSVGNNFADKVLRENKNEIVEILPTTQYYSSPDKLCKTTTSDIVFVNGNMIDDPKKKFFHPVQKDKKKSKTEKKNSNYVADIMRIGLSNKEINERENILKRQKKKLGIPKDGYIEGIRSKNNASLFKAQRQCIAHRQNLNRRTNEFRVVKKEATDKGTEMLRKRELVRSQLRVNRLHDLSVEDSFWKSRMDCNEEIASRNQSSLYSESNSLHDMSQMSDFKHVQEASQLANVKNEPLSPSMLRTAKLRQSIRPIDTTAQKEEYEKLLKQKVLEVSNLEMQSTVSNAHCEVSLQPHSEVSPRVGESTYLDSQSRMEEVNEAKEIQYLENHKWVLLVVDLLKGLAAKRRKVVASDKEKNPATPNSVFLFVSCMLRVILIGVTLDRESLYILIRKIFSNSDLADVVVNQVITLVRICLKIKPKDYCDYLYSIGVQPPKRLLIQIKNATRRKRLFSKVKAVGAVASVMKDSRIRSTLTKVRLSGSRRLSGEDQPQDDESDSETVYSDMTADSADSLDSRGSMEYLMGQIGSFPNTRHNSVVLGKLESVLETI